MSNDKAEFEITVDGELVSYTFGLRNEALNEALHYYEQYKHDGNVEIYEVIRKLIPIVEVKP